MADGAGKSGADLHERVEALEAAVAAMQHRPHRSMVRWGCFAVLVGFAGWATAQTPVPGEAQRAQEQAVIQKGTDGVTRVRGPFQVVNASGTVILSVAAERNPGASVSIHEQGDGGTLTAFKGGTPLVILGPNRNGFGTVVAADAAGKPRAVVLGSGGFQAMNEAGRQVAALAAIDGSGVVGVWSSADGERIAALSQGPDGAGELTVFDKGRRSTLARLGADANGGSLKLFGAGKADAAVNASVSATGAGEVIVSAGTTGQHAYLRGASEDGQAAIGIAKGDASLAALTVNRAGAGDLTLGDAEGALRLEAVGAPGSNPARGGSIVVYNKEGDAVSALGTQNDGSGVVIVQEKGKLLAALVKGGEGKGGQLQVNGPNGEDAVHAAGGANGGGVLIFNKSGDPVASVASSAQDKGTVTIFEKDHEAAELTAAADGSGYLFVADTAGKIALDADGSTGTFTAFDQGRITATVGATDGRGRLAAYGKDGALAELAENEFGAGMVFVRNSQKKVVAGMTGGRNYSGTVLVRNGQGATLAEMNVTEDGRGQFMVSDASGSPVATMADGPGGAGGAISLGSGKITTVNIRSGQSSTGYFQLLDESGRTMVEGGVNGAGVGMVNAGPNRRCAPSNGLRLPDCLVGVP